MKWADKPIKPLGLHRCIPERLCIQPFFAMAGEVSIALRRRAVRTGLRRFGEAVIDMHATPGVPGF